jgi:DNA-binding response OmpR family regulator
VKRLLVIEDHPWVLQVLCRAFQKTGWRIESATTLRQARELISASDPFDLVVCEQHLSDGNGLELLAWLRWQQHIAVPFLLITRSDSISYNYAHDFSIIAKPFRDSELLASVHRLLRTEAGGIIARQIPFAASPD